MERYVSTYIHDTQRNSRFIRGWFRIKRDRPQNDASFSAHADSTVKGELPVCFSQSCSLRKHSMQLGKNVRTSRLPDWRSFELG